jgi:putative two-component system response regulator
MMAGAPGAASEAGILVVDDAPANLELLSDLLRSRGYEPRPVLSGAAALAAAQADPPDLVLLDVDMPGMDGYEVCRRLKADERLRAVPVMFVSAVFTQAEDKVKALSLGAVDYVTKPYQAEEVYARVATHLRLRGLQLEVEEHSRRLEHLVEEKVEEIVSAQMATIFALAKLAEYRDDDTGRHLERVSAYSRILAEEMTQVPRFAALLTGQYVENLSRAAPLHDIGKVGIPDAILLKPGRLTTGEFDVMKRHTELGAETLRFVLAQYPGNDFLRIGIAIAQSHHERWDGSGYPQGLAGEAIPVAARVVAVADVYDAIRSRRSYKDAMTHEEAAAIVVGSRGTHFDARVVDAFSARADEFAAIRTTLGED